MTSTGAGTGKGPTPLSVRVSDLSGTVWGLEIVMEVLTFECEGRVRILGVARIAGTDKENENKAQQANDASMGISST